MTRLRTVRYPRPDQVINCKFSLFEIFNREALAIWQSKVLTCIWNRMPMTLKTNQDIIWHHLSSLKAPDGNLRFSRLSKITKLVLVLSHSNAQEERIFSMVRKKQDLLYAQFGSKGNFRGGYRKSGRGGPA